MLHALYITTQLNICTISLNFPPATKFKYAQNLIVLNVPGYNNVTTRTAGIPQCFTGKLLFGYTNKLPIGGFELDDKNEYLKYE